MTLTSGNMNDSVQELDNLLDDLNKARLNDERSYGKALDKQQRFYSSMSNLTTTTTTTTTKTTTNKPTQANNFGVSPTPLQKIAANSSPMSTLEVDLQTARLERELGKENLPRGVFVKDVVEEEILVDHVPMYQPETQRSDRRLVQKNRQSNATANNGGKRQVAFSEYASSHTEDYDESYDNTDTEHNHHSHQHMNNINNNIRELATSMQSLNSELTDASTTATTTLDPSKIVICYVCNERVLGQVITALNRSYHKEHFTCVECHQELGTKNFYERDNRPYCERDYQNLFSPKCAACQGPILDKVTIALDQTFHPEHFICAHCGCQFEPEDGFHEKDGRPYCKDDFFELFANKCMGCGLPITANYITALEGQWHADCFVCSDCHCPFADGKFFDIDGAPYCEIHYHARRGSLCAACKEPVIGKCTTAMFRKFHPEHFTCTYCLKTLTKTFKEEADKPYCHDCFDKLYS